MSKPINLHFHQISILKPLRFERRIIKQAGTIELQEATGSYRAAAYYISGQYICAISTPLHDLRKSPVHITHVAFTYLYTVYQALHFQVVGATGMVWLSRYFVGLQLIRRYQPGTERPSIVEILTERELARPKLEIAQRGFVKDRISSDMRERGRFPRIHALSRLSGSASRLAARRILAAIVAGQNYREAAAPPQSATPLRRWRGALSAARPELQPAKTRVAQPRNANTVGAK